MEKNRIKTEMTPNETISAKVLGQRLPKSKLWMEFVTKTGEKKIHSLIYSAERPLTRPDNILVVMRYGEQYEITAEEIAALNEQ